MINPKDKAIELIDKMFNVDLDCKSEAMCMLYPHAVRCALIAVDEIIKALNDDIYIQGETDIDSHIEYWKKVKQEIENI